MSEFNFKSIEKLTIPDELTERLLAIPDEEERKPAVPLWRRRALIAAASFILITALSLLIYFSTGNIVSTPPAVAPLPAPTVSETDGEGTIAVRGTAPTGSPRGTTSPSEAQRGTYATLPSGSPEPSAAPHAPSVSPPAVTEHPITEPETVKKPTSPPTYAPTDPSPVFPTEPEPIIMTEPAYMYYIQDYINPAEIVEGDVYCWIMDESGNYAGDGAVFSPNHKASVYYYSPTRAHLYWYPYNLDLPPANYYYTFVDKTGKVLASGYERKYL